MIENAQEFEEPAPNLDVIYQAFGDNADLYRDVLQVKSSASSEHIQMAYFDRRSELFALLASIDSEEEQDDITASHRFHAERKMDAVVMAVRILGDISLRQEYDAVVAATRHQNHREVPQHLTSVNSSGGMSKGSREPDGVYAGLQPDGTFLNEEVVRQYDQPGSPQRPPPTSSSPPPPMQQPHHSRKSPRRVSQDFDDNRNAINNHARNNTNNNHAISTVDMLKQMDEYEFDFAMDQTPIHPSTIPSNSQQHQPSANRDRGNKERDRHIVVVEQQQHHQEQTHQAHHHNKALDTDNSTLRTDDDLTFPETDANYSALDDGTLDTKTLDGEGTVNSLSTTGWTEESPPDKNRKKKGGNISTTLSTVTNQGFVSRIQEEVAGTVEDTLVSFEQVLNVFTLQEKDIKAVMGRIDKAKRQLSKR